MTLGCLQGGPEVKLRPIFHLLRCVSINRPICNVRAAYACSPIGIIQFYYVWYYAQALSSYKFARLFW